MMRNFIICISFIIFSFTTTNVALCTNIDDNYSIGLIFKSHEVNKDERTSLNLTPSKPFRLPSNFTLEFDLKLRPAYHSYGYVCRIIANDTVSLDMTSDIGTNKINVILNNTTGAKAFSEFPFNKNRIQNQWVKIIIKIGTDSITYSIGGRERTIDKTFINPKEWKIFLGANKHEHFYTSDVPPMSIKDLIIKDQRGKPLYKWSMSMHGDNIVYDDINNYPAVALNSLWELDKHTKWKREISLNTRHKTPQIAYDSINARVFAAIKDSLYIINIRSRKIERFKVEDGAPQLGASSQLLYDYKNNRLISYDVDQDQLLEYDFEMNKWSGKFSEKAIKIQHHNKFIDIQNNQLVVFGGYGFYKYSAVLYTHSLSSDNWEQTNLIEQITPRYLASMGYLKDGKILIFGGYGSTTGKQEESSRNLYDLHELDIYKKSSIKIGEIQDIQDHLAFGNSMVINHKKHKFYTLSYHNDKYKTFINLLEVDMETLNHRLVADSIPYNFYDIESYCDLFSYKDSYLYAVVSQKLNNGSYNISIYSLMYPPLAKSDIMQSNVIRRNVDWIAIILVSISVILTCLFGYIFLYRKKIRQDTEDEDIESASTFIPDTDPIEIGQRQKASSSVLLLGGFQVFNSQGKDITNLFTPIIRQMFLMLLLESITTGKGITSQRLDETFWFDMDKVKATNNRNVNISKLRLLLQDIGNIKLQKNGNYWQIIIEDDVLCDYKEVKTILNKINEIEKVDKSLIGNIINVASSGVLLPNLDAEWADKYKADYSSTLIEVLLKSANQRNIQEDLRLLVKLADIILLHDSIDEDSIQIKCRCLYKLGQKGLSKQCYDKFRVDYKNILNEYPTLKYEDITQFL
ncbi:MAG: hypothetical protein ACK5KT_01870 [Dysgonomonas sp.]